MLRNSKELKRIARGNLADKYNLPMRAYLYTMLITMLVELPFSFLQTESAASMQNIILYIAEFLISVVAIVLTCGEYRIHLKFARGEETSLKDYFYPVTHQPDRYILARLIHLAVSLVAYVPIFAALHLAKKDDTMLWAIPLLIIGLVLIIIISVNFNLVYYFMLDNEELEVLKSFKLCQTTMRGHKGRFFYISLSFIGMLLLSVLSLGIALLWVNPYMNQTLTLFYLDMTGQLDSIEAAKQGASPEMDSVYNPYI